MKHTAQTLPSARLVKVLGADARIPSNDEEIDRGPLTMPAELTEADWIAADLSEDEGKAQRRVSRDVQRGVEEQVQMWRLGGVL